MNGPKWIVLIPAFNEEKQIGRVIRRVREACPTADILAIDDGSQDRTREEVCRAGGRVVSHPFNLGYGGGLQTGYRYALKNGYDCAVQMDGDGQHDPISIQVLLDPVVKGEADVVIGSRFFRDGESRSLGEPYRISATRRLGMRLFGSITSYLIGQKISDSTTGFQAMNRRVLQWVASDRFPSDYPDADVLIMLHRAGFRIREVPVRMFQNQEKKSMHSGWKPIYYVFKMFLSILVTLMRKQ
jgi:glycosyltransferase involved in cell wall biosynthesis